jgi:hypothetical protein
VLFNEFLEFAGDRLSNDPAAQARYEYVWNSAIRAAATSCQAKADAFSSPEKRAAATACAEAIMELWDSSLSLK